MAQLLHICLSILFSLLLLIGWIHIPISMSNTIDDIEYKEQFINLPSTFCQINNPFNYTIENDVAYTTVQVLNGLTKKWGNLTLFYPYDGYATKEELIEWVKDIPVDEFECYYLRDKVINVIPNTDNEEEILKKLTTVLVFLSIGTIIWCVWGWINLCYLIGDYCFCLTTTIGDCCFKLGYSLRRRITHQVVNTQEPLDIQESPQLILDDERSSSETEEKTQLIFDDEKY